MLHDLNTLKDASESRKMLIILMKRDQIVRKAYKNLKEMVSKRLKAQRKLFAMFLFSMKMRV